MPANILLIFKESSSRSRNRSRANTLGHSVNMYKIYICGMYKYIQDFYTLSGIKYLIGGIDRFASPISLSSRIRLSRISRTNTRPQRSPRGGNETTGIYVPRRRKRGLLKITGMKRKEMKGRGKKKRNAVCFSFGIRVGSRHDRWKAVASNESSRCNGLLIALARHRR